MIFVAHRAGNTPERVLEAQHLVEVIELDVHRGRQGRVEVRHAKTLWPTRRLWDRWYLLPAGTVTPSLDQILDAVDEDTGLWFDLKGVRQNAQARIEALASERQRTVIVSSKSWWLLGPMTGLGKLRTFRSVGNRLELALLLWLPTRSRVDGTVINRRLLTPRLIERLRHRGPIFTWGVTDRATIEWLERHQIAGVIIDDLGLAPQRRRSDRGDEGDR